MCSSIHKIDYYYLNYQFKVRSFLPNTTRAAYKTTICYH
jgi:hypothetical protein